MRPDRLEDRLDRVLREIRRVTDEADDALAVDDVGSRDSDVVAGHAIELSDGAPGLTSGLPHASEPGQLMLRQIVNAVPATVNEPSGI